MAAGNVAIVCGGRLVFSVRSGRVCSWRNTNRMKMPKYSRRFPTAPRSLLVMLVIFYAQTVPLAGIQGGCRWLCIGFTLEGRVGC